MEAKILVVDDKSNMLRLMERVLAPTGRVFTASSVAEAKSTLASHDDIAAVLSDVRLLDGDGLDVLREARRTNPSAVVVLMTAYATVDTAVRAMREGAYDFVSKPFEPKRVRAILERAIAERATGDAEAGAPAAPSARFERHGLVGASVAMRELFESIEQVARTNATVLLLGETGAGKELVARAIHASSARAERPLYAINCAALPASLVESELFGHTRGAFTGATRARAGLFESANGSTILLDEVGDLPLEVQAKLTRVLEARAVLRLGETQEREVDVRVIAATHRDLRAMVDRGAFREDLWFRLNVFRIDVPPLRERREDIAPLARAFLARLPARAGAAPLEISEDALRALEAYEFPGNVRELKSAIERAAIVETEPSIRRPSLPVEIRSGRAPKNSSESTSPAPAREFAGQKLKDVLRRARDDVSRRYVAWLLDSTNGDVPEAARLAGIERESFYRLMRKLGVRAAEARSRGMARPTRE